MTLKTMESYSSKTIKLAPYLYSHADSCFVTIKGENVHLYYKQNGIHKVIKEGRVYCWSDNSNSGFNMPAFLLPTTDFQWTPTNATRKISDVSAHLCKGITEFEYYKVEEDGWIADPGQYNISNTLLNSIYSILYSSPTGTATCLNNDLCLKYTNRVYASAATERAVSGATAIWGNASIAGNDKSQADNASTNEVSTSFTYEIISISPSAINDTDFIIPTTIKFFTQEKMPTMRDYYYACAEIYPSMKRNLKFLESMGTSLDNTDYEAATETQETGAPVKSKLAADFYQVRERVLLVENQKALKKAKKNKEQKNNNQTEVIIYDINEEWDF